MTETSKVKPGGLDLSKLPDWVKILILLAGTAFAGGGGVAFAGTDYSSDFDELNTKLEQIQEESGDVKERVIRLEVEMENLKKSN